ncbi:MAG: 4Fe-4S binding protein [Dehalococcoidia bacterium]|nr:4Fe-4S binding protein [Dehalococcoidia bacterium]
MATSDVYTELMARLKYPQSERFRRILQKLVTPEEGKLLLELPAEPAELAKKSGLDEEAAQHKLQEFMERGLIIRTSKGLFCLARDMTQLHDANLSSAEKWVDTELLDLWRDFRDAEWKQTMAGGLGDSYVQALKVIPAWKAMERSPDLGELLPDEDIRELIRGADAVSVIPCPCRRSIRRCDLPVNVCMHFNRGAEYAIGRGAGRRISAEESIAIAGEAEEAGLVHTWASSTPEKLTAICNCCRDCCDIFAIGMEVGNIEQILQKSRFRAEVDQDLCTGCQDCVERCFFEAIEMKDSPPSKKLKATIEEGKCFGCGLCAIVCEPEALTMKLVQT